MRGREATRGLVLAIALVLTSCGPSYVGRTYGLGRAADAALTSRPVAITPDGGGLPAGHGSVAEGETIYAKRCANCHDTPAFPQLWGGVGSLLKPLPQKSVGSYWPYATTVYDYIDRAMPPNARVPLRPAEVYALTAFILAKSGIVGPETVLDAHTLPSVRMPNRAGFFSSDGKPGKSP